MSLPTLVSVVLVDSQPCHHLDILPFTSLFFPRPPDHLVQGRLLLNDSSISMKAHTAISFSHEDFFNTPPSTLLGWFLYTCTHAVSGKEDQRIPVLKWLSTAFSTIFRRNFIRLIVLNDLVKVTSLPPALEMNATLTLLHFLGITKA